MSNKSHIQQIQQIQQARWRREGQAAAQRQAAAAAQGGGQHGSISKTKAGCVGRLRLPCCTASQPAASLGTLAEPQEGQQDLQCCAAVGFSAACWVAQMILEAICSRFRSRQPLSLAPASAQPEFCRHVPAWYSARKAAA